MYVPEAHSDSASVPSKVDDIDDIDDIHRRNDQGALELRLATYRDIGSAPTPDE